MQSIALLKTQPTLLGNLLNKEQMMSYSFEEEFGFEPPRVVGAYMAIAVHKHIMTGTHSESLEIPEDVKEKQKWASIVGRVVKLGSACFKGDAFKYWEDVPKVGDWIVFKPNQGPMIEYRGKVDLLLMYDDAIKAIIEDPFFVTRD